MSIQKEFDLPDLAEDDVASLVRLPAQAAASCLVFGWLDV